ncbi:transglutaminaseTgpA domain-containing protein [Dactylosporangium sp. AC04546]|uniref:transglutaminase TgpA family protein n=1 Tax=Dactylosporangium sp. AC04546 TaxID=2862460 RepID=UPI001EDF95F1|nr:transglutaminaseTgpA domain-containing protein [Dactylosporangium sp. AC04546]WVK87329.1 transglutaminaseTgpA domain-containing protein [Dactylosporangium sp. AC04546]
MSRSDRIAVVGLLGSTAVAGLLFAPVFGLPALLPPVLVVVLACYGCVELGARRPRLASWRPLLVLLTGALGLVESVLFPTTVAGLPTAASLRGLQRGFTDGWLLTLQSTWPARPDPEQLLFVPLAVLLAGLLGIELLLRLRKPVAALLPGLAVAGLAQTYQALTGGAAVLAAACYVAPAALLLRADRPRDGGQARIDVRPAVAAVLAIVAGTVLIGGFDPAGRDPYRLKDAYSAPLRRHRIVNPLQEIAQRLAEPDREVFRYRSDRPADRWSLVVLDGFDGANWSAGARLYRLGAPREGAPGSTVRSADVRLRDLSGPWLPSQPVPLAVGGLAPLVDPSAGTLLLDEPAAADTERRYRLTWSEPEVKAAALGDGSLDTAAAGGLGELGTVPAEIRQLAEDAVQGARPTFQSALRLERFLSEHYQVVHGGKLPTGHGWPQLRNFLTESRRGTSEQFAAAYVVLARLNGIPARLVVGFRGSAETDGDSYVVRNRDVLAWPEVPVAGVGWVPLDPTAAVTTAQAGPASSALDEAVAQVRAQQGSPPPQALPSQPGEKAVERRAPGLGFRQIGMVAVAVLCGLLVGWLLGVPLAKAVRTGRRRRRTGTDGVIGAWAEVRDRLRAHGVPYGIGMTPRDLAGSAAPVAGEPTTQAVIRLGRLLDTAVWSGVPVTDDAVRKAWDEVRTIRRGLAGRPLRDRLRAAVDPRVLVPPGGRAARPARWHR